jgi:methyl-accepting chemotaxis protein
MSDTSQHQSDSISSIAANIEEMSVSISEMAGLSGHSQQRAQQSGDQCDKGSEEIAHTATAVEQVATDVKKTSDHVSALGDSSREISSIVSSIRDIADQNNLLALNAAIEAARAGEQGRGFAVVADEVRKLAERTALSTDEISNMIQKIQSDIDSAVKGMNESSARALISIQAVREARTTMNEIAVETRGLVTEMGQMTHSLDEQRHGSNAIAKAVENISADAEMNSTSASRVADTAREMVAIADQLTTSVATFKT